MPSEKSTQTRFRQNLLSRFDRINRVENPLVPGMPDTNCCFRGIGEFWIEIKTPKEPVRSATPLFGSNHRVSQDQINWHRHQWQCDGRSFFLIDTDKRLLLMNGFLASNVNAMTVEELIAQSVFHEPKPMRKEKWKILRNSLRS